MGHIMSTNVESVTATHAGNAQSLRGLRSTAGDCPDTCPETEDPVTDANGLKYQNECFMKMMQCQNNPKTGGGETLGSTDASTEASSSLDASLPASGSSDLTASASTDASTEASSSLDASLPASGSSDLTASASTDASTEASSSLDASLPASGSSDLTASASTDASTEASGSLETSAAGSEDEPDLTVDYLVGSGSDAKQVQIDLMSLIGSGSNQVDLEDIIDALGAGSVESDLTVVESGKGETIASSDASASTSGSDDIFESLFSTSGSVEESSSSSADPTLVKSPEAPVETATKSTKAGKSTKTSPGVESSVGSLFDDSSSGVLSSESQSLDADPTMVKSPEAPVETATKSTKAGKSTKTSPGVESSVGSLFDDSSSGVLSSESQSLDADPTMVKSPEAPVETATKSTKAGKSTKTSPGVESSVGSLFDDSSSGVLSSESQSLDADPTLVKDSPIVVTKAPVEEATKMTKATKSTKSSKSTKTSSQEGSSVGNVFEDGSEGVIGSQSESEDPTLVKNPVTEESESGSSESGSEEEGQHVLQESVVENEVPATKSSKTA
ncbi:hypothetical protein BBJ29_007599 [Phytophthora kernoviae]|uniref:Kazal-like domain-containing protein n=1 Tax=Phytophthora kernoviae TaxID=325452 RepID=A0A421FYH8_9STRA|nr:hypothetical protein BBJ29_007599 [Phytophthora kernoviae]